MLLRPPTGSPATSSSGSTRKLNDNQQTDQMVVRAQIVSLKMPPKGEECACPSVGTKCQRISCAGDLNSLINDSQVGSEWGAEELGDRERRLGAEAADTVWDRCLGGSRRPATSRGGVRCSPGARGVRSDRCLPRARNLGAPLYLADPSATHTPAPSSPRRRTAPQVFRAFIALGAGVWRDGAPGAADPLLQNQERVGGVPCLRPLQARRPPPVPPAAELGSARPPALAPGSPKVEGTACSPCPPGWEGQCLRSAGLNATPRPAPGGRGP
ncbi:hypothetical protein P7K49_002139 [Saguinus oedipus]|uniref:Uncharacterized protein n=1 Tax=Saguinus oedipus TaxID=9490 RepID=A0ABQ9WGK1_SAGOE|nr:hypothetical protein P7K49_002139 [Saguinus oedipus]